MHAWLKVIGRNGRLLARFTDVEQVRVRTIRGDLHAPDRYQLSIVMNGDEQRNVHQLSTTEVGYEVAEDMSDIVDVEVH